jgi:hypothetical protein
VFHQDGEGRVNFYQKEKIYAAINKEFNEIWFFYPRFDERECNHYIKYNFAEQVWDFGSMNRTVWTDRGIFNRPYAVDTAGTLFLHEIGYDDDARPINAFITTAYFDIADGEQLMYTDRIIPDITLPTGSTIQVSILTKKYPHPLADIITKGPYVYGDESRQINFRARGRQMALEFRSTATNGAFSLGKFRISAEPDGER